MSDYWRGLLVQSMKRELREMERSRCQRCGHSSDWHRLDHSTNVSPNDPLAEFRCIGYDCTADGPVPPGGRACDCPDFVIDRGDIYYCQECGDEFEDPCRRHADVNFQAG